MNFSRRQFLLRSLLLSSFSIFSRHLLASHHVKHRNILLGGGQFQVPDTGNIHFVLSMINPVTKERDLAEMRFLPHGIHRKPTDNYHLAIFEKQGPGACEFDLNTRSVVRTIKPLKNRHFYGHGTYSKDGRHLYSTESFLDTLDGVITIRDSETLAHVGDFPSYGKEPHECKLIDGGKTLIVTNGGGSIKGDAPCISYIDIASQRLLEKIELTNARLNTGHLAVSEQGDLIVASAPRRGMGRHALGGVSIRPRGSDIHSVSNPQDIINNMFGEALSVAIHNESGIAAVTHPGGNMVTLWNIHNRHFIKAIAIPRPRGVILSSDKRYFLITAGEQTDLRRIDIHSLKLNKEPVMTHSYISGSHIYDWSGGMQEVLSPGPLW